MTAWTNWKKQGISRRFKYKISRRKSRNLRIIESSLKTVLVHIITWLNIYMTICVLFLPAFNQTRGKNCTIIFAYLSYERSVREGRPYVVGSIEFTVSVNF